MNKAANLLKPLMPILSTIYGIAVIYITALPVASDNPSFVCEVLTWLITLTGIALTLFIILCVEAKVFSATRLLLALAGVLLLNLNRKDTGR